VIVLLVGVGGKGVTTDPKDAIARLKATQLNLQQANVYRLCGVTTEPMVVRHVINQISLQSKHPYFAGLVYAEVKKNGLRISKGGSQGQFGDGAYAWPADKDVGDKQFIDVQLPAGTALELLSVRSDAGEKSEYFRIMPHPQDGSHISGSEVLGTNIDPRAIELYQSFTDGDFKRAEVLFDVLATHGKDRA
jgi:hypothetical protein